MNSFNSKSFSGNCPLPITEYQNILLAHGGGGKLMHQLLEKMIIPSFKNQYLEQQHDGAVIEIGNKKIVVTTDSFVVNPLFFPGGNIGTLAVNGTVNDVAMCGAKPLYLSAGFIIEEGLPMETFWKIIKSMEQAAKEACVQFITGDTKVVDKGKGDGIFINTTGIGIIEHDICILPKNVQVGDDIVINGDIGRHGITIMAVREGLSFESNIESDCASLSDLVLRLLDVGIKIHCMRDLTRGGLASALNEIASAAKVHISIDENAILVIEDVRGACEILGIDPLYVACEGRFICFVPPSESEKALKVMRTHPLGVDSSVIGKVTQGQAGRVTMKSKIGATRIVDMISGEQLPRIC